VETVGNVRRATVMKANQGIGRDPKTGHGVGPHGGVFVRQMLPDPFRIVGGAAIKDDGGKAHVGVRAAQQIRQR